MVLPRRTLILLVILVVVIAAGVVGFVMFPDQVREALGGKTNANSTTNTSVNNTNTSTTPTNLSTPQDLSGDTALTATVKIGMVDVKFTSLDRLENFDQTVAPANQRYVVVYFEGLDQSATAAVFTTMSASQLVDGNKRYSPDKLKVATNVVANDRGYVVFLVPTNAGKLVLEVGSGAEVQRVELP